MRGLKYGATTTSKIDFLSLGIALVLGTAGLPHVLVRFYTNPDGAAARRTALAVIALLSLFYLFPTLLGVFARQFVPQLLITGTADAAVLLLPSAAIGGGGGAALAALVAQPDPDVPA